MKHINVALAVIVDDHGQVLLTQRHDPDRPSIHLKWQLPGGGVNQKESIADACIREAYEETGLNIRLVHKNPNIIHSYFDEIDFVLHGFLAEAISGTINTDIDEETADAKWVSVTQVPKMKTLLDTFEMITLCNK